LRRWLASADFFSDCAMLRALRPLNTPGCKSSASLRLATSADHLRGVRDDAGFRLVAEAGLRPPAFGARFGAVRFAADRFCAVRFRVAMAVVKTDQWAFSCRECAALRAAAERSCGPLVCTARRAAAERSPGERRAAAERA
jgi:hypothetical protein